MRHAPIPTRLALLLGVVAATGCAADQTRTAPFRLRPDSVEAGDLRGPFNGRVVEAASERPVAGALVYATWTVQAGYGVPEPAGHREYVTSTDSTGRYEIPAFGDLPGDAPDRGRITDFFLVVYKRGFVGYRSDRRFADLGPRHDFAQKHNEIRLQRWRTDLSHARHLRYVGGGPAIAALTAWEAEEAAAELSAAPEGHIATDILPGRGAGAYLVAAQLLTDDDIREVTGYDGDFETGPLGDEPDTATYSSQHFKALGRAESYDVALRLWRLDPETALERYTELVDSLPSVDERNELATKSLRAKEKDIHGFAFYDEERGIVALLTCGQDQCDSGDAAALARRAYERVVQLAPPALSAPIEDEDTEESAPPIPGAGDDAGDGGDSDDEGDGPGEDSP